MEIGDILYDKLKFKFKNAVWDFANKLSDLLKFDNNFLHIFLFTIFPFQNIDNLQIKNHHIILYYEWKRLITWRVTDKFYKELGKYEPKLTQACRSGSFIPMVNDRYVILAQWKNKLDRVELTVAWWPRWNLRDEKKLADPKKVYMFYRAGLDYESRWVDQQCEVYSKD